MITSLRIKRIEHLIALALTFLLAASCVSTKQYTQRAEHTAERYVIDSSFTPDPSIEKLIQPYKIELDEEMGRIICELSTPLSRTNPGTESALANLYADAILWAGKRLDKDVEVAFGTNGALRSKLPAGPVTVGQIYEVMPFDNKLSIIEIPGQQLRNLVHFVVSTKGQPIAGLRITRKNNSINQILVGGKPIDLKKTYKLATYDYLANGGDKVPGLAPAIARKDADMLIRNVIIDYLSDLHENANGEALNLKADGRLGFN